MSFIPESETSGQLDRIKAQKETNIYTYLFNISPQK